MTPEERALLEKTYKLSEENNTILRGIRRSQRWSTFMRYAYWVVIVLMSYGAYALIQPYLNQVRDLTGGTKSLFEQYRDLQN